jgi:YVTN family beta-propeller protein
MTLRDLCCPCAGRNEESEGILSDPSEEEVKRQHRRNVRFLIGVVVFVSLVAAIVILLVVLLTPTTSWKWVAYITSVGKVSVMDIERRNMVATVPVGTYAYGVAITQDGRQAWTLSDTNVLVIDTGSYQVLDTIVVSPGTGAILLAIAITSKEAYVTRDSEVIVIDIQTRKLITSIAVDPYPYAIDITSDGKWACVTSLATSTLSFIDTERKVINETVSIDSPMSIVISPNGEEAFVSSIGNVFIVDIKNRTINGMILVDENSNLLQGMAVTSDGKWLYVSNEANGSIAVIETATRTVNTIIPVQGPPNSVALTSDAKQLYVTSTDGYIYIYVIDTANNATMVNQNWIGTNPYIVVISLVVQ